MIFVSPLWQSPAIPALLLLFGLTFSFAFTHIVGFPWVSGITRTFYAILLLWGIALVFHWRVLLRPLICSDWLVIGFVLWVVASLLSQHDVHPATAYYAKLLPFLVLLPYCLGRLMQVRDRKMFLRSLPLLGLMLLQLCVIDYWWAPNEGFVYERLIFFGVNHSPLLIASLVSVAVLASAFFLLQESGFDRRIVAALITFSIFIVALVLIAARGALITCTIALILMVLLNRHVAWRRRMMLVGCFILSATAALYVLPKPQADFYARIVSSENFSFTHSSLPEHKEMPATIQSNPKCNSILEGYDSVAIRRLLYTEAIELTVQHPLTGVGAARFGSYSCGGPGTYPHSTVLQAFAELGILGGTVLLLLYATSFWSALRVYDAMRGKGEIIFWIVLIAFFALTDQIYGSYFMASGSFFIFGLVASLRSREDTFSQ